MLYFSCSARDLKDLSDPMHACYRSMKHRLVLLVVACLAPVSNTLKCISGSSTADASTCEGDYCYVLKDSFGLTQNCVSGITLKEECITDTSDNTMCICKKAKCNDKITEKGRMLKPIKCYSYSDIDVAPLENGPTSDGLVCVSEGTYKNASDGISEMYTIQYSSSDGSGYFDASPFPLNTKGFILEPVFGLFYYGEMYLFNLGFISTKQYCNKAKCNQIGFNSFNNMKTKCSLNTVTVKDSTCYGDFCAISTREWFGYDFDTQKENVQKETYQYCMGINSTQSENAMGVGVYKHLDVTTILCNTDMCNKNNKTATEAVDLYKKPPAENAPPENSPVDAENAVSALFSSSDLFHPMLMFLVTVVL